MYDFDWTPVPRSIPFLWTGMKVTLRITVVAMTVGIALGTVLAIMRLSKNRVMSWLSVGYVNTFRSIPLIMVLLWFFLIVPSLIERIFKWLALALLAYIGSAFFARPDARAVVRGTLVPTIHSCGSRYESTRASTWVWSNSKSR